jgi:hypothetical protein
MIDDSSLEEYEETKEKIARIKIKIFLTFFNSLFQFFIPRTYNSTIFLK